MGNRKPWHWDLRPGGMGGTDPRRDGVLGFGADVYRGMEKLRENFVSGNQARARAREITVGIEKIIAPGVDGRNVAPC